MATGTVHSQKSCLGTAQTSPGNALSSSARGKAAPGLSLLRHLRLSLVQFHRCRVQQFPVRGMEFILLLDS